MFCKARNNFESTRAEVERLMKRIRSAEEDFKAPSSFTMEGYLYIQEKREAHTRVILVKTKKSQNLFLSFACVAGMKMLCCTLQARWAVFGPGTTVLMKKALRCSQWAAQSPEQPADRWAEAQIHQCISLFMFHSGGTNLIWTETLWNFFYSKFTH